MNFLFGSRRAQPATVPSDKIVLLRSWDTALSMRGTVLDTALIFHDVLDIFKLHTALDQLFSMGNWSQLGARLRLNDNNGLEYHIPQCYDDARPAFIFTNVRHEMSICSHPLTSQLPEAVDKAKLFVSPEQFTPIVRSKATPQKLDEWIYSDNPQLFIHAVTFDDATILTVTFPHTLADVMGIGIFMSAWSAVVRGDLGAVPTLEGFESNPLTELGKRTPAEKYVYFDRVLNKGQLIMFVARRLTDSLWYRQEERRTIFLPARCVKKMREKAVEELARSSGHDCVDSKPFVSESDIILAWWTRTLYIALGLVPSQRILLNNAFNLRTSLHDSFASPENAYLGNCVCMSPTFLQGHHLQDEPLSKIARRIRQSVSLQQTAEQVEAVTALLKQTMEKSGYLALIGEPGMLLLSSSNWHKAGMYGLDFSSAVTTPGKDLHNRTNDLGKPSHVNGVLHSDLSFRNTFAVTGRDAGGNWWLNGVLRTDAWAKVKGELEKIDG
ncbi:hypothetical protein N7517_003026 [Penicillium concentricum]|uniref:Uncharacterized protein n=1 Tax=Penicillium concentricum TaxID=293559 RepID=A0A9W9SV18_9EURO|nr:uncharacterized protein N7517_003026 [Penicillium concentricum]KAJ5385115.1 hypothetical protein N7517_003026 [Penicillium concentricum]